MPTVAEVRLWGRRIGAVSLGEGAEVAAFEFEPEFIRSGIEVAPLAMPLAERAGVAKRTLGRIEAGQGSELASLLRVLRALDLLGGVDALIPDLPASPLEELKRKGLARRRVRPRASSRAPTRPWEWAE